jgi:cell wall-associated NlpC family hydrolase
MPVTTLSRPLDTASRRLIALTVALLTVLTLTVAVAAPADAARRVRKVHDALAVARNQKGDPYRWGAEGPDRFDCSGLTQFAYRRAGLDLPRTSDAQARYARKIKRDRMRKGDLIFFHKRRDVYHVGIFAGWNRSHTRRKVLHAPRPGRDVHTDGIWTNFWFPATLRRPRR